MEGEKKDGKKTVTQVRRAGSDEMKGTLKVEESNQAQGQEIAGDEKTEGQTIARNETQDNRRYGTHFYSSIAPIACSVKSGKAKLRSSRAREESSVLKAAVLSGQSHFAYSGTAHYSATLKR